MEYREEEEAPKEKEQKGKAAEKKFYFITGLPIKRGHAVEVAEFCDIVEMGGVYYE